MKTITLQLLRAHAACKDQQDIFASTFGESANLTARNMAKAIKVGLDVFWLERLIPAPALAEYDKVRASAWAEYDKARASAWAEYEKVRASALLKALKVIA